MSITSRISSACGWGLTGVGQATRRKMTANWSSVECLEGRALLSASSGQSAMADVETIEPNAVDDQIADAPALKFGKLNQIAGKQAKQAVSDFSGGWNFGISTPPSPDFLLVIQQNGRKVLGTMSLQFTPVASIKGRIVGDQLIARMKSPGQAAKAIINVSLQSADTFDGTLLVKNPGDLIQIFTFSGAHQ